MSLVNVDGRAATRHWLLVRPAVYSPAPHVLGSYGCRADANDARTRLGGELLEIDFWQENDPGYAEGISYAAEWLIPDGSG